MGGNKRERERGGQGWGGQSAIREKDGQLYEDLHEGYGGGSQSRTLVITVYKDGLKSYINDLITSDR